VKAFLSVSRGIKGISIKLKGGVIHRYSFKGGCDVNITVCHDIEKATSRS